MLYMAILSKAPDEMSKRLEKDSYAKLKYDATARQDSLIIGRIAMAGGREQQNSSPPPAIIVFSHPL